MQVYSDPSLESDPHALPDVEVFRLSAKEAERWTDNNDEGVFLPGWYYWHCFPGCLPDSDPIGPFASADEAAKAAQED